MSVEVITWALKQPVGRSSAKFVLVAMANLADADGLCWPSMAYLEQATDQDRKTVLENIKRLREMGWIRATDARKGVTKSVVVYQLCSSENGTASPLKKEAEAVPKTDRSRTENGTSSKVEAVPFFPVSSPEIPGKQSRFSVEAVPKTGHGTVIDTSRTRQGHVNAREPPTEIPDWMPVDAWRGFCRHRGSKFTAAAQALAIRKLDEYRTAGMDPEAVLNQSVMNGWKGLFALKATRPQADKSAVTEAARKMVFGRDYI